MVKFSAVNEQVHICYDSHQVSDTFSFGAVQEEKIFGNEKSAPQSLGLTQYMIQYYNFCKIV